jgi:hypothetical protein
MKFFHSLVAMIRTKYDEHWQGYRLDLTDFLKVLANPWETCVCSESSSAIRIHK